MGLIFRFLYEILFKKSLNINIILFISKNNFIFFKNITIYNLIINFYNIKNNFQLLFSNKFKYSWVESKNDFNKFYFNINNYKFVDFFNFNNKLIIFKKFEKISYFVKIKKKFSIFKKINSLKKNFLSNNLFFKNNINNNIFNKNKNIKNKINFKNFEFVEKKLFFYKNNRKILKYIFQNHNKIENYNNKLFKKISKLALKNFIKLFEFSLKNILQNSNFFLNSNDLNFFIKNKFVKLNGSVVYKSNLILKKNDFITINYNKYYFFFYKNCINSLSLNINKHNNFFKSNSNKIKNELNFINKLVILKNDVPNYLEVDYISMSLILLNTKISYNCYNLKITNIFLKRLNN